MITRDNYHGLNPPKWHQKNIVFDECFRHFARLFGRSNSNFTNFGPAIIRSIQLRDVPWRPDCVEAWLGRKDMGKTALTSHWLLISCKVWSFRARFLQKIYQDQLFTVYIRVCWVSLIRSCSHLATLPCIVIQPLPRWFRHLLFPKCGALLLWMREWTMCLHKASVKKKKHGCWKNFRTSKP